MTGRPAADEATAAGTERRPAVRLLRRVLPGLLSLAVVVVVFWYFLPQFTSISDVWASVRAMTWLEIGLLVLVALWNLATYWLVMVATMPGLTYPQVAVVTQATTSVSKAVPGGAAIGTALSYTMYSSWGFSRSRSSVSLLVSGVWNNFAKLGMPVLALALLALQGDLSAGRLVAALAGLGGLVVALVLFALLLRSEETARRIGVMAGRATSALLRLIRRPPVHGW